MSASRSFDLRAPVRASVVLAVTFSLAVGCKDDGHVRGTPSTDDVAEIWEDAGLALTEQKRADASRYGAGYCSTGRVSGLEVLICEFTADAPLASARTQLQTEWSQQGLHTAVVVQAKRTLVALMDRSKADSQGRTMNKLVAAIGKL